jgi:hypothetical protein
MKIQELWYIYGMGSDKRKAAKVYTETEAKKLKDQVVQCGATFYVKSGHYGLLYCKPNDYAHWETWAKAHGGKIIEWDNYTRDDGVIASYLYSPNHKQIAYREMTTDKSPSET